MLHLWWIYFTKGAEVCVLCLIFVILFKFIILCLKVVFLFHSFLFYGFPKCGLACIFAPSKLIDGISINLSGFRFIKKTLKLFKCLIQIINYKAGWPQFVKAHKTHKLLWYTCTLCHLSGIGNQNSHVCWDTLYICLNSHVESIHICKIQGVQTKPNFCIFFFY